MEMNQLARNRPLHTAQPAPTIACDQQQPPNQKGPSLHLVTPPEYLPKRVPAEIVVLPTEQEVSFQFPSRRCSHGSVMVANLLGKSPRFPSLHARRRHRDPVDAATFDRRVSPDGVKTFSPEQLTRARHMLKAREPIIIGHACLCERRSYQAQLGILIQLGQKKREVISIKR